MSYLFSSHFLLCKNRLLVVVFFSVPLSRSITGLELKNWFYTTDRDAAMCEGSVQLYSGHRSVHMYCLLVIAGNRHKMNDLADRYPDPSTGP